MMTPRERVLAATGCGRPDRLPLDLGGSIVTGINAAAYHRLKAYLGLGAEPVRVTQAILMLAEVEPALRARWRLDVAPVPRLEAAPGAPLTGRWRLHPLPAVPGGGTMEALFPEGFQPVVRGDVRRRIETLGEGGGFVFAPIHNLQADIPPRNIAAMYEEALRF